MIGSLWARNFGLTDRLWGILFFILTIFLFVCINYHRSIFFEFIILFIFMFFVQFYYTIISFTWWIIRTTSFLVSITFVVCLMSKRRRCFLGQDFSASVIVSSFDLFLGLTGSLIGYFLIIEVSGVFLIIAWKMKNIWCYTC